MKGNYPHGLNHSLSLPSDHHFNVFTFIFLLEYVLTKGVFFLCTCAFTYVNDMLHGLFAVNDLASR